MKKGKQIVLVAQHDAGEETPTPENIYEVGVLANILQLLKLPDGTVRVLVEGITRVGISELQEDNCFWCMAVPLVSKTFDGDEESISIKTVLREFEAYTKINSKVVSEAAKQLDSVNNLDQLVDMLAGFIDLSLEQKQALLEMDNVRDRMDKLLSHISSELDVYRVEKKIRGRVKKQMEKSQREYYLNEQMKAIQNELGESDEGVNEIDDLLKKVGDAGMSKEAREKLSLKSIN